MHRGKTNKIQFILCWILFVTQVIDAIGSLTTKSRDKRTVQSNATSSSFLNTETLSASPEKNSDEKMKNCHIIPNISMVVQINVNDTNAMQKLNVIAQNVNLTKHDTLEGFAVLNRVKKDIPVTLETMTPSPKTLKKKETGHGKIFLLSSIISNGNVINGNIDTNNYDHINKRNSKGDIKYDETNHGWKYRKPIKFQKIIKPSLGVAVNNNQDSNKLIYEIYNKNSNHGGETHDNKKLTPILPSRLETINSNLLIDYLFPSMFKNIFSQLNHQYLPPSQIAPFNEIGYTDRLVDGWFNLKEENPVPIKCTCSRLRKPDEFDLTSKTNYPKDKFSIFRVLPHGELEKLPDNQYETNNMKDPSDKSLILTL